MRVKLRNRLLKRCLNFASGVRYGQAKGNTRKPETGQDDKSEPPELHRPVEGSDTSPGVDERSDLR